MKGPFRNSRFLLEIDSINQGGFSEVTIPDTTIDSIEYREGNMSPTVTKIPGLVKYANVVLKWGITDSMDLYKWHKDIIDGKINSSRKTVHILLLDETGQEAVRWTVVNAWPTKYSPAALNAKGNDVHIETLELANQGITREK